MYPAPARFMNIHQDGILLAIRERIELRTVDVRSQSFSVNEAVKDKALLTTGYPAHD